MLLKIFVIVSVIIAFLIILLFFIRLFSEKQLDDVSPDIPCSSELLLKADKLFIIPKFNNQSIAENSEWCNYILSLNKSLALHGLIHKYKEFSKDKTKEDIQEAISIFEKCFNLSPTEFKPPQLAISRNNKDLIKKQMKMKLNLNLNQLFHKVYHCNDTGKFPNWVIDVF